MGRARVKAVHTAKLPKEENKKLDTLIPDVKIHDIKEKQRRNVVRWTDDEWLQLAYSIHAIRINHPDEPIWELARLAQDKLIAEGRWKKDRTRALQGSEQCKPLFPLIKQIDADIQHEIKELKDFRERYSGLEELPTKDEIVNGLTDQEIIDKGLVERALSLATPKQISEIFSSESLFYLVDTADLLGYAAKRFTEDIIAKSIKLDVYLKNEAERLSIGKFGVTDGIEISRRKSKVAIVGGTPNDFNNFANSVREELDLYYINPNRLLEKPIPIVDHIVCFNTFINRLQDKEINQQARKMNVTPSRQNSKIAILKRLEEIAVK